jgi:hypothetical protein
MNASARILKKYLETKGISVWICTDMSGGTDYRSDIFKIVTKCYIFLPLLNTEWRNSGECKEEYNVALRLKLTSYEDKTSIEAKGEPRRPVIMPLSFSDLDWKLKDHVFQLGCNANFIPHEGLNLLEGKKEETLEKVYQSIAITLRKFGQLDGKDQPATKLSSMCGVLGDHLGDTLQSGEHLKINQHLHSKNGIFSATLLLDGNFIISKNLSDVVWHSNTSNTCGSRLTLQKDRNLVIYNNDNKPVWATCTTNGTYEACSLRMQDDGNLVLYDPNNKALWASAWFPIKK